MERTGLKTGSTGGRMPDYKEKTNHGDALMPVRYYHCSVPNSYRNLSLHWHEEMEITLIRSGPSITISILRHFRWGKGICF